MGQIAEIELTRWKELLEGLKPLGENDRPACLCASPDETRVYYTKDDKDYLITNGQIAELHFTKAAATANTQVSSTGPAPVATDVTPHPTRIFNMVLMSSRSRSQRCRLAISIL
jgi:hypothetical protein